MTKKIQNKLIKDFRGELELLLIDFNDRVNRVVNKYSKKVDRIYGGKNK